MLIPKIKYLNKTTGTINGQSIMTISMKNDSVTNGTISSATWSYNTLIGTASLSNSTDEDVSLVIDNTSNVTAEVILSVTDSDGFTAETRIAIVKSGADVTFIGHTVDSFVLADGLTEFTISDDAQIIDGAPVISTPAYTQYDFDKENDSVVDSTSASPTTFSHTYTSVGVTAKLLVQGGLAPFILFTEISFNPIIENPKDLDISIDNECKVITVFSETENYLSKLVGRGDLDNSTMSKLDVTLTKNCCTSQATTVSLCPTYNLNLIHPASYTATGVYLPGYYGSPTRSFEIYEAVMTITGIDASVISSITYTSRGDGTSTTVTNFTNPVEITVEVLIESTQPNPPGYGLTGVEETQTNTIQITNTAGCTYTITYTLSLAGNLVTVMDFNIDSIDFPDYPCGVTVTEEPSNTTLSIDSNFGTNNCDAELEAFADGILQVTLNDSGISNESVSNCVFVNCETYCLVVEALSNGCNPFIGILYDALVYSANCPDVTCQNLCDLYEIFAAYMEQCDCTIYQNNVLSSGTDCGCNS
jgi:hypothetical protein